MVFPKKMRPLVLNDISLRCQKVDAGMAKGPLGFAQHVLCVCVSGRRGSRGDCDCLTSFQTPLLCSCNRDSSRVPMLSSPVRAWPAPGVLDNTQAVGSEIVNSSDTILGCFVKNVFSSGVGSHGKLVEGL